MGGPPPGAPGYGPPPPAAGYPPAGGPPPPTGGPIAQSFQRPAAEVEGSNKSKAQLIVGIDFVSLPIRRRRTVPSCRLGRDELHGC